MHAPVPSMCRGACGCGARHGKGGGGDERPIAVCRSQGDVVTLTHTRYTHAQLHQPNAVFLACDVPVHMSKVSSVRVSKYFKPFYGSFERMFLIDRLILNSESHIDESNHDDESVRLGVSESKNDDDRRPTTKIPTVRKS